MGNNAGYRKVHKEAKRKEAEARNDAWAKLTPQEQIKHLDKVFGIGKGAKKQRAKIEAKIKATEQKKDK